MLLLSLPFHVLRQTRRIELQLRLQWQRERDLWWTIGYHVIQPDGGLDGYGVESGKWESGDLVRVFGVCVYGFRGVFVSGASLKERAFGLDDKRLSLARGG